MSDHEMGAGWVEARVIARQDWAAGLMTLCLDRKELVFEAGQFFNLGLKLTSGLEHRAYSAASAPGTPLEFFVAMVDDGAFSPALFALGPGDSVWVERKPQGFFTLRYVPEARHLWLVATGTGLGPFLSMLRGTEIWGRFEKVVLVHGVRDASQVAYRDELQAIAKKHPFKVVTCMSRSAAAGALAGRVTEMLSSGALEAASGMPIEKEHAHIMLCGNPAMILEMTELFKARGLQKHRVRKPGHISVEKYW